MKRTLIVVAALAAALLVQLTIVNGLALPGGGAPDLVLLCVVAIGLTGGPQAGLIAGFCAGLALDLAPPANQLIGQYALVFCLVGYACGRLRFTLTRSAVLALASAAGVAVAGEILVACLVLVLDTPQVTLATVAQVLLPSTVVYDLVLSPVFIFAAVRIAVALGVTLNPLDDSPALEIGGSAQPTGLADLVRARRLRRATGTDGVGVASGAWLTGDSAADVAAMGTVGWLSGPPTSRRARREQARLTAALTGAAPRKGSFWVGSKPAGLRPTEGSAPAQQSGLRKLRPESGVAGTAARAGMPARLSGTDGSDLRGAAFDGSGSGGLVDGSGWVSGGANMPKIAFGTGGLAGGAGRAAGRGVPKIAFKSKRPTRPVSGATPSLNPGGEISGGRVGGGTRTPKIAFGTGGLPGAGPVEVVGVRRRSPSARGLSRGPRWARPAEAVPGVPAEIQVTVGPVWVRSLAGRIPDALTGRDRPARSRPRAGLELPRRRVLPAQDTQRTELAQAPGAALAVLALAERRNAMIPASRPRLIVLYLVVAAMLLGLLVRIWDLQVKTGVSYAAQASSERVRQVIEPPVRGPILDDLGTSIVSSHPALVISVSMPTLWKLKDGGAAVLTRLAALLHVKRHTMIRETRLCTVGVSQPCWPGSPYQPIPIAEHVSSKIALQVLEDQRLYPGVTAAIQPVTSYNQPISTDMSQIVGYLQPITAGELAKEGLSVTGFSGVDLVGQAGLEQEYDKELRGQPGVTRLAVNAAGQVTGTLSKVKPTAGDYLVTSINPTLQADTLTALSDAVRRSQFAGSPTSNGGAAVVMTTTGRVLAMASYPTYDPAVWTGGISKSEFGKLFDTNRGEPVLNRATQGQYPPGSTLKVTSLRGRGVADEMLPVRQLQLPGRRHDQRAHLQQRRGGRGLDELLPGARGLLRHRVLPAGLRHLPEGQGQGRHGHLTARAGAGDAEDGACLGFRPRHGHRPA